MRNYLTQPLSESQCQDVDECIPVRGPTLFQMAQNTATREAILKARDSRSDGYWVWLAHNPNNVHDGDRAIIRPVWDTLPGNTCLMDALRLIAFARLH